MGAMGRSRRERISMGMLGALAVLALMAPSADARFKPKTRVAPKVHVGPNLARPHTPSHGPELPKAAKSAEASRGVSASKPPHSVAVEKRGFFQRFSDWLFGRKPPVARAPTAPAPARPLSVPAVVTRAVPAPAAASPAPAPVMPIVLPPAAATTPLSQPKGQASEEQKKLTDKQFATVPVAEPSQPKPRPTGYVLHLTNGRSISVGYYEEKGDQVVIPMQMGSYGFPKSSIARIEARDQGTEVTAR